MVLDGARAAIHVSQGVRALTSPIEVAEVHDAEVRSLGGYPALSVLVRSLPASVRAMERILLHLILGGVTFGDPLTAIRDGRYRINPIVAANPRDQSIILALPLARGERLFWGHARHARGRARHARHPHPRARGAGRRAGVRAAVSLSRARAEFMATATATSSFVTSRFPGLPVIGIYGNGELGPPRWRQPPYQYSTVLGLFKAESP